MTGTQSPREDTQSMHDQVRFKRRNLRKGTHSCWECKRRKMRCIADASTRGVICQGCRRRGTACVGQEIPEEVAFRIINSHEAEHAVDGAVRTPIDTPGIGQNILQASWDGSVNEPLTPALTTPGLAQASYTILSLDHDPAPVLASERSLKVISQRLYAALPSPGDTKKIFEARPLSDVPIYDLMTMPYASLSQDDLGTMRCQLNDVDSQSHPVLIARYMLVLASSLLHLDSDLHPEIRELSEKPQVISERMVRLANHYVTSEDYILGSVELLECVLIESVYQANLGNLRRSWMISRRASNIAQLMGLDRPNRHAQYQFLDARQILDPQSIWRRVVFLDHFLCVMLSLPPASPDSCYTLDAGLSLDIPKGQQLEQLHCTVASRILEYSRKDFVALNKQKLQELDAKLQRAARSLPTKWWLVPRFDASQADSRATFWNTGRIFAQVLHYNLVYRLHLPYMFHFSPMDRTYEYSRITCVSACREILTRFLALRTFNGIATSCRIIDFIALMAALTLLLAHLHLQASTSENLLAHQYHSDRAIIEQIQESMEQVDQLKSDPLSARSADLLGRLMAIDIYEDDGFLRSANNVSVHPGTGSVDNDEEDTVNIQIPYFGLIKIARDTNLNLSFRHSTSFPPRLAKARSSMTGPTEAMELPDHSVEATEGGTNGYRGFETSLHALTTPEDSIGPTVLPPAQPASLVPLDHAVEDEIYPGLAADIGDWTFQGVDLAFFDTIMHGMENNAGDSEFGSSLSATV